MFTAKITKEVKIQEPNEKGILEDIGTVRIRKLSARSLDKAREAQQISAFSLTAKMGSDMIKAFRQTAAERAEVESATKPAVAGASDATPKTRYGAYDRDTVLTQGIASWSFPEDLIEGIADLDEPTAELLFHEIVDLSDPPPKVRIEIAKNV